MTQFGACFKKDMLETFRTKRFWFMLGIGLGMVVLSVLVVLILNMVANFLDEKAPATLLFLSQKSQVISFFMAFMSTYFVFIAIFMFCNILPKEIKNKKWINPVSAGINPKNLVISKLLMVLITTVATAIVACLVHFVFTLCYVSPELFNIPELLLQYLCLLVYIIFIDIITICLGTITKHGLISGAVVIGLTLLFTTIFQYIPIGTSMFINYTPFLFWQQCSSFTAISASQILWASLSTLAICIAFIVWALLSTKIKGAKKLA